MLSCRTLHGGDLHGDPSSFGIPAGERLKNRRNRPTTGGRVRQVRKLGVETLQLPFKPLEP